MKTLPLAEAKAKLSRLVDRVAATDEEILITRNGRPAAILISPDEYPPPAEAEGPRDTIYEDTFRLIRGRPGPR